MISIIFRVILLLCSIESVFTNPYCGTKDITSPKFKLLKRKARSQDHILTRREIPTLEECLAFAVVKKGLAFNFSSMLRRKHSRRDDIDRFNCQVLACPGVNSLSSLVEDEKFNYYSAYSRKLMLGNETAVCVPTIGLFVHKETPQNYTNARSACENIGGKLSNVMSAERTAGLSPFLFRGTPVYVGLSNRGKERYWKNEFGDKLECSGDRRWAQGEPTSRGCVGLIRSNIHGNNHTLWKVFPCSRPFPFICEILPRHARIKTKTSR
ncbi:uncharacterized protein LOC107038273 [Diachasma alloeum]|uniref:uncharacterized protein LOC107038273 n=1 Tax=Diachasma alloeum TaxID=454923 RepID=UPI000738224A|nr:uncharacterized protein LOC107038273 [Diachasma alloeum]